MPSRMSSRLTAAANDLSFSFAGHARIQRVTQYRVDHHLRVAVLAQDRDARERVAGFVAVRVRPPFIVEVMEQARHTPQILVFALFSRVSPHRGFHGEHVTNEAFGFGVLTEQRPRLVAIDTHVANVLKWVFRILARHRAPGNSTKTCFARNRRPLLYFRGENPAECCAG